MVSVTKEHFFILYWGMPTEVSEEIDLMQFKSGRVSELDAGLNMEEFKRGGGRWTGVLVGP